MNYQKNDNLCWSRAYFSRIVIFTSKPLNDVKKATPNEK